MLSAHARVDVIGSQPVRAAAKELRSANYNLAASIHAPKIAFAEKLPKARGDFLRAIRAELQLPELSASDDDGN
jgi:hypothetical protein